MITLRQLYTVFGHDERWRKFATACTQPMVAVYLRKLGDTDITLLTEFDIELQEAMCQQPEERKVKARSCMHHLLNWAKEQGKKVITIAAPGVAKVQEPPRGLSQKPPKTPCDPLKKEQKPPKKASNPLKPPKKVRQGKTKSEPKPAVTCRKKVTEPAVTCRNLPSPKPTATADTIEDYADKHGINIYDSPRRGKPATGTIYHDHGSKGYDATGKRVFKDCWRAEITIAGERYRHRSKDRKDCEDWLKAVKQGKIKPTDNKADWWRMEQHKDEEARIDELIVSAAEEANIVYEYRQTGDTQILYDYCVKALLPHMVWYCAHTLHLGRDRSLTCSRQAVGLILTKIVGGRPVTNITFTCKRMLRTYKNRGDFWYYDKAPEAVRLMVNRIDMTALAELYKVTKDRRI